MRKSILLIVLISIIGVQLRSQVLYPTQPEIGYYENLKATAMPKVPSEAFLKNITASAIPAGFKDTLLKYDWYEIADYWFYDNSYNSDFLEDLNERETKYGNNEFKFKRYTDTGVEYRMSLDRHKDSSIRVTTITFDEKTATKLIDVKNVGTQKMLVTENYGETEMQEILSYNNGILVMCIKEGPYSTNKKFHIAYLAFPKTF